LRTPPGADEAAAPEHDEPGSGRQRERLVRGHDSDSNHTGRYTVSMLDQQLRLIVDRQVRAAPRLTPAGERILEAASTLFYEQGIRTVGVDAIAAAADVTKKTLYDRFGSKDRLIAAYLEERDRAWHRFLDEHLAARQPAT